MRRFRSRQKELIWKRKSCIACRPSAFARDSGLHLHGARETGHSLVSNGEWYIRELLPPGIPVRCYYAELGGKDSRWRVTMPPGVVLQSGEDFKVHVCEDLCREHPDRDTVFIGDGRNDFPVASHCKYVFAVKDSTLAKLCAEAGKPHVEFESFETVVEKLIAINE